MKQKRIATIGIALVCAIGVGLAGCQTNGGGGGMLTPEEKAIVIPGVVSAFQAYAEARVAAINPTPETRLAMSLAQIGFQLALSRAITGGVTQNELIVAMNEAGIDDADRELRELTGGMFTLNEQSKLGSGLLDELAKAAALYKEVYGVNPPAGWTPNVPVVVLE